MLQIGYKLSSEEHPPLELVRQARRAEATGFSFAMISDHFHPWTDRQGHSPFVWSVIGAIANATEKLIVGTAVTCPTVRIQPAIVAHAAATAAAMMPGRFILGLGTGENLNEHIFGDRWPPARIRREMLAEGVQIIRDLWSGKQKSHYGEYYQVENARIYTLPDQLPPIMIAAGGSQSATLAGEIGDGLVGTAPEPELFKAFDAAGGAGKPRFGELTVCWAQDEKKARQLAYEMWPIAALQGPLLSELALPSYFEQAAGMVDENDVAETVICGPEPQRHLEAIKKYADAGYDHVFIHQIGDQDGFFEFYKREVLPKI